MSNTIRNVEIFSAGKWNGDEYTQADLQEMVNAFNENKGVRPYLKLGHDSKQKLLQADGLPAAGWVDRIYIVGNKLCADFVDIPTKIYDLIKNKAYKKVSSEIFWNISIGDKTYKRMLAAVALLGADTPGVMNLNDILAMYKNLENTYEKIGSGETLELKEFNLEKGDTMSKTENEIKLELELQAIKEKAELLEAEKKDFALKQDADQKELEALKQFKADAEKKEQELKLENEKIKTEKFVSDLIANKLCTPAMKDLITELCGPDKKEYSKDKLSKEDAIKEMLKLFRSSLDVNFDESSLDEVPEKKNFNMDEEMTKKAKEYMEKNKCSYAQAAKAVLKESKKK